MNSIQFGQVTPFKGPFANEVAKNYATKLLQQGFPVRLDTSNLRDKLEATVYTKDDAHSDTTQEFDEYMEQKTLKDVIKETVNQMMKGYTEDPPKFPDSPAISERINDLSAKLIDLFKAEPSNEKTLEIAELKDELKEAVEYSLFGSTTEV